MALWGRSGGGAGGGPGGEGTARPGPRAEVRSVWDLRPEGAVLREAEAEAGLGGDRGVDDLDQPRGNYRLELKLNKIG